MAQSNYKKLLAKISLQSNTSKISQDVHLLAETLKVPAKDLLTCDNTYHAFKIPKKNGEEREILAPIPALKELQKKVLFYLKRFPIHPAATAFAAGGSATINARCHLNQAVFVTVDIKDFFLNTHKDRIYNFFIEQGWEEKSLAILMKLCAYKNSLPQGAPTSPYLSNIVNKELDENLYQLAICSGATYTRYSDDLTFSWPNNNVPGNFKTAVVRNLSEVGYEISQQKGWKVHLAEEEPEIVGIVLGSNGKLRVPERIREKVHQLQEDLFLGEKIFMQLQGYQAYIKGVEKNYFTKRNYWRSTSLGLPKKDWTVFSEDLEEPPF